MRYILLTFLLSWIGLLGTEASVPQDKIAFWQTQKKGANVFNRKIDPTIIKAAKQYGIGFIRLAPDKFPSRQRDFLIGTADKYEGLVPEDLKLLKDILDRCAQEGIPVVLTMLSLPGSRWVQHNNNTHDLRLWKDAEFQSQAAQFWQDLARELKDHPAIVGYNILNEPHPERVYGPQGSPEREKNKVQANVTLHTFYKTVIAAIRAVDPTTPIILDSSNNADAQKFSLLEPFDDSFILYSFHFYEPYVYTNFKLNKGKFKYPGVIPDDSDEQTPREWNKDKLRQYLQAVIEFQKQHSIPNSRILVGEFGGHRMSKGLDLYFRDLLSLFNEQDWHFAVYAFREDTWDGMDYELGSKKLPWSYWKAIEEGKEPAKEYDLENPIFSVLKKEWQ